MNTELLYALADQLEREYGPCVMGREALIKWLDDQINRLVRIQAPGAAAMEMIRTAYLQRQAESIGLELGDDRQ